MAPMRARLIGAFARHLQVRSRLLSIRLLGLMGLMLIAAPCKLARGDEAKDAAREGARSYSEEDVEGALEAFERAARLDPDSPEIQYNLGTTLARSARYGEAVAPLIESLASRDVPSRRDAFFNLGYSRVRRAQTEGGVLEDPSVKLQLLRYGLQAFREAIIAAWSSVSRTLFNLHEMIYRY